MSVPNLRVQSYWQRYCNVAGHHTPGVPGQWGRWVERSLDAVWLTRQRSTRRQVAFVAKMTTCLTMVRSSVLIWQRWLKGDIRGVESQGRLQCEQSILLDDDEVVCDGDGRDGGSPWLGSGDVHPRLDSDMTCGRWHQGVDSTGRCRLSGLDSVKWNDLTVPSKVWTAQDDNEVCRYWAMMATG